MVVLTKVDEADPKLEEDPDVPSKTIEAYKKKLASKVGMSIDRIEHTVNYHLRDTKLNFKKDRHSYVVIRKVLDLALQHKLAANKYDDIMC